MKVMIKYIRILLLLVIMLSTSDAYAQQYIDYESRGNVYLRQDVFSWCWNEKESFSRDENNWIIYNGVEWGGLVSTYDNEDWSGYEKVVFEFAEPVPVDVQIYMDFGTSGDEVTNMTSKGATSAEFSRGSLDWSHVHALVLQPSQKCTLKITSVYLKKKTFTSGNLKYHELKGMSTNLVNTSLVKTEKEAWGAWWETDYIVNTADGRRVNLIEQRWGDVNQTGDLMSQEILNLPGGEYEVVLYASSYFTPNWGFESDMRDYANDVAYVFANGVKKYITCRILNELTYCDEYTIRVKVSTGRLRIGFGKDKPGTNWHAIQIKSLKLLSSNSTPSVELVDHNDLSGNLSIPSQVKYSGKTYNVVRLAPGCLVGTWNVNSVTIPEGVEEIGWQAFIYSNFTTFNISSTVQTIGDQAFNALDNNTAINVDAGNQWLCSEDGVLFSKDKKIIYRYPQNKAGDSYVIPNTVEILGTSSFDGNTKLHSVTIPQSCKDKWWGPFLGCTNLTTVICQVKTALEYSDDFFDQETYKKGTLYVPSGCVSTYKSTSPWNKFKTIKEIPSQITVTARSYEITYGDALPNFGYDVSDNSVTGTPKITCSATKTSSAGTYDINIQQGTMSSPGLIQFVKGKLTIKKAPLTISVGNYTKKQGDPMPTFKLSYSGFKNSETESVLTKKPTISCRATATSGPGDYPITLSEATATNYNITLKNGTLTVTKAEDIVVTAKSYTINYGDAIPSLGYSYTTTGDGLTGTPKISCSAGAVGSRPNAGVYDIIVEKGTISNYKVTYVKGTLTVNKAPLTVSVGNYTKKQGDPMPTFKLTYSGFKLSETESVLTKKPTISCSATATSAPGDYPITLSGATATNYSFTYKNGTLTVTNADAIVVTAKSYTINYGDAIPSLGYSYTTNGDGLTGTPKITCSAGAVGSRPDAGVYDIIVEKGSVSNFNVSYVKGTLTVKKVPLTVSVGNYSKYEGEDMPKFTINYSGFKKGETKNSLTRQPVASCEANKWSPAGSYPITLSGGDSPNYDFTYNNGTLTVKHVYNMTIMSQGNGSVNYGSASVTSYQTFDVKEGTSVKLTFVPNDGYKLSQFTVNGEDVTSKVTDNTYSLGQLTKDVIVVASFTESTGSFKVGAITYSILSAPERTVVVDKSLTYRGHMTIPETVTRSGDEWRVVGIADNAFNNCASLVTISLPQSLKSENMGLSLFTGCTKLAAITWNANFVLTTSVMGTVTNPNLLFYTKNIAYPPKGVDNVIVNGTADNITLYDATSEGDNFYCPTAFTADKISYSHSYAMESAYGGVGGWETLALPFTVQKITHERVGEIVPFAAYDGSRAPFWLYTYSSSGFIRANAIEANVPYIICMPNNNEYDAEYRLSGKVTFSAQNAVVATSNGTAQNERPSRGNKTFIAAYKAKTRVEATDVYAMNVINERYSQTGGYNAGSIFISNLRSVAPFEAVMTTGSATSRVIDIEFNETSGIESLPAVYGNIYNVYNLNGQLLIQTNNTEELDRLMNQLPAGVYIVNGKKMIINK